MSPVHIKDFDACDGVMGHWKELGSKARGALRLGKRNKTKNFIPIQAPSPAPRRGSSGITAELVKILERKYNIKTARNTISNDLTILVNSGLHIEVTRNIQNLYYYDGAPFELAELKVLIDAISATKFITSRKSKNWSTRLCHWLPERMLKSCAGMFR